MPDFQEDITKSFLTSLANSISKSGKKEIIYTSVYHQNTIKRKVLRYASISYEDKLKVKYGLEINSKIKKGDFNIWYTAENIRPPLDNMFDAFLSYDLLNFSGRNHYLPLWFCRLGKTVAEAELHQVKLMNSRALKHERKKNFSIVASNPERIRNHFIEKLGKHVEVGKYGKLGHSVDNKNLTLREYNFNICFENDLYPGYVTEKAIEAYQSGCIPIWRGLDAGNYLNKDAIIDVTNLEDDEAIEKILSISSDRNMIEYMRNLPILIKGIDITGIANEIHTKYINS